MATSDAPFLCFLCVYVSLSLSLSHTHSHSIRNSVFSRSLRTDTQHGSPSVCLATTSDAICVRRRTRTLSHSTSLLSHLHAHHRTPSLSLSSSHTQRHWVTNLPFSRSLYFKINGKFSSSMFEHRTSKILPSHPRSLSLSLSLLLSRCLCLSRCYSLSLTLGLILHQTYISYICLFICSAINVLTLYFLTPLTIWKNKLERLCLTIIFKPV